jgi:hypothetical protein
MIYGVCKALKENHIKLHQHCTLNRQQNQLKNLYILSEPYTNLKFVIYTTNTLYPLK